MTQTGTRITLAGAVLSPGPPAPDPAGPRVPAHGAARRERDWIAGRLAMSRAFRLRTGDHRACSPQSLIAYRANGQPYLPAAPALWCSIAHSCGWAIAGISSSPIGVDIEKIRRHHPALLPSLASPEEISRVAAHTVGLDHLVTVLWTIKEAVMKATGDGLSIPPRRVRVDEFDGRSALVIVIAPTVFPAMFHVTTVRRGAYSLSIAHLERDDDIPRVNWH